MPLLVYVIFTLSPIIWIVVSAKRKATRVTFDAILLFYAMPLITLTGKAALISNYVAVILCAVIAVFVMLRRGVSLFLKKKRTGVAVSVLTVLPLIILLGFGIGVAAYSSSFDSLITGLPTYIAIIIAVEIALNETERDLFLSSAAKVIPITAFGSLLLVAYWPKLATISSSTLSSAFAPDGRLSGPLLHPNALGTMCAVGLILALTRNKGFERIAGVLVCGLAILLTDQRSAQLSVIVGCAVFFFFVIHKTRAFWFVLTMFVTAGSLAVLVGAVRVIEDLFGKRTQSLSVRQDIYNYIFHNLNDILPFGLGPTGLYEATNHAIFVTGVAHAHNTWLSMFVIGGLISGIAFIVLSIWCATNLIRYREIPDGTLFVVVALLSLSEAPPIAGSNWTIVPIAMVTTLAFMPMVRRSQVSKSTVLGDRSLTGVSN